jgi:outer membrane beta-barrel protein
MKSACKFTMIIASLTLLLMQSKSQASESIRFPEEELATESVLPVFDNSVSVKNRTVQTAKRFELGFMGGMALNEPFASPFSVGGELSYHLDEDQAINFYGTYFMGGNTRYVGQINNTISSPPVNAANPHLENAPDPKYLALLSYQYTAFYGKLSLTKNYVMNLSSYGLAGVGGFMIGDSLQPLVGVGFGQKFHFTPNFALRFDLRLLIYQGPDVAGTRPFPTNGSTGEVPSSAYEKRIFTDSMLSLGAVYLIPNS